MKCEQFDFSLSQLMRWFLPVGKRVQGPPDPPYPGFACPMWDEIEHGPGELPIKTMVCFVGGWVQRADNRIGPPVSCLLEKEEHLVVNNSMDGLSTPCFDR